MGLALWWLNSARDWALSELTQPRSIGQWQTWREDVRQEQVEGGMTRRRIPQSAEPPALVLMRDYFAVCLIGAVVFISLLYWVIAWFLTGIVRSRSDGLN